MNVILNVPAVTSVVRQFDDAGAAMNKLGDSLVNDVAHQLDAISFSDGDFAARQALKNATHQITVKADRLGAWARNIGHRYNNGSDGILDYLNKAKAITATGTGDILKLGEGVVKDWRDPQM